MSLYQAVMMNKNSSIVLNLTFDGIVRLYAETNAFFISKLASDAEISTIQLGCNGALRACTSINSLKLISSSLGSQKDSICQNCIRGQSLTKAQKRFVVQDNLSEDQREWLSDLRVQLENRQSTNNILSMKYHGLEVNKIIFYDWSSLFKLQSLDAIDESHVDRFMEGAHDFFCIFNSLHEVCKTSHIKYLLYVNGNYSLNTAARLIVKGYGINSFSIESQPFSNHFFNKATIFPDRMKLSNSGLHGSVNFRPPKAEDIKEILGILRDRILGIEYNAYTSIKKSPALESELKRLGEFIDAFENIHVYFAHSQDEVIPHMVTHGYKDPSILGANEFNSQEHFFLWLINNAHKSPNVGFIVRLHPRMAPNKRENLESDEHKRIMALINHHAIPSNLLFITADSLISSYYLMLKSTMVIIGWSTVGIEALCLGKSVISIFPKSSMYPIEYFSVQPNRSELKQSILNGGEFRAKFKELGVWIANAYELQFFQVPVLRSTDGVFLLLLAKIINVLNRIPRFMLWVFSDIKFSTSQSGISAKLRLQNVSKVDPSLTNDQISEIFINHKSECISLLNGYGSIK